VPSQPEHKVLIVKGEKDSFQKYFNDCFTANHVTVLKSEQLTGDAKGKIQGLFETYRSVRDLERIRYFEPFEKIIIFEELTNLLPFIRWVKGKRIIYWTWNKVDDRRFAFSKLKVLIGRKLTESWTFDDGDAEKYHMKMNPQYFEWRGPEYPGKKETDLCFIGYDKGRYGKLRELKDYCRKQGFRYFFRLIRDGSSSYDEADQDLFFDGMMDYTELLTYEQKSGTVVDLVREGQTGFTLRSIEAVAFDKKIITNNKSVRNGKFYSPEAVYILGEEERELKDFLREPFSGYPEAVKEYYNIASWLKRFDSVEG
jgi:hypothetical protein